MTEFGRTSELNEGTDPAPPRTVTGPAGLARYGEYGFTNGPQGGTGRVPWSNVTIGRPRRTVAVQASLDGRWDAGAGRWRRRRRDGHERGRQQARRLPRTRTLVRGDGRPGDRGGRAHARGDIDQPNTAARLARRRGRQRTGRSAGHEPFRSLLSVYTALPVTGATLGGEPLPFAPGEEVGWRTATGTILVPPNGHTTMIMEVRGRLALSDDGYSLSTRPQPLALPEQHRLVVRNRTGAMLVNVDTTANSPQH